MNIVDVFIVLGTIAFAISGALSAMEKKMDVFGVFIIAFVTALGGGTIRDILIGQTPVFWMLDLQYFYLIIVGVLMALLFSSKMRKWRKTLFIFDTIGLGIFTIAGVEIGMAGQLSPIICIILGTITGSFGGVLRDVLSNQTPLIFHKEIYATICVLGGSMYYMMLYFQGDKDWAYVVTSLLVIASRVLVTKKKWILPKWY